MTAMVFAVSQECYRWEGEKNVLGGQLLRGEG